MALVSTQVKRGNVSTILEINHIPKYGDLLEVRRRTRLPFLWSALSLVEIAPRKFLSCLSRSTGGAVQYSEWKALL